MDIAGLTTPALAAIGASGLTLATTAAVFGVRKLVRIGQFSYHNSRLSTAGNPYVRKDEVLPLIDAKTPFHIAKTLNSDLDTGDDPRSFRDVDRALMRSYQSIMTSLLRDSPDVAKPVIGSYMARLEAEELKRLLRLIGFRKEPLFPVGSLTDDLEVNILSSGSLSGALDVLEGQPISKTLDSILRTDEEVDLSSVDEAIDRFVLERFSETASLSWSARRGMKAFRDIYCDRYNIHMILRSRNKGVGRDDIMQKLYLGGGIIGKTLLEQMVDSAGNKEAISVLSDTHMEKFLRDADPDDMTTVENSLDRMVLEGSIGLSHSFSGGVGPTLRYMVSKEMELKNIRTLFKAGFSGFSADRTRRLLVLEEGL